MTNARRFYRLSLALGGLGALAVMASLAVALSNLSLAVPPLEEALAACGRLLPADLSATGAVLLGLVGLGLIVLLRGLRSVLGQARAHLRVRAGLRQAVEEDLDGLSVRLLKSSHPQAFCAGLLRPRAFLSTAARERLSKAELRAVLAHEVHHVRRRDPLRRLAVRVLADALFFLPALRRLERRYAELAELAADEAAVRAAGSAPLASALLKLGASDHPHGTVAIAPERVDHLRGVPTRWRLGPRAVVLSFLAVAGIGGVSVLAGTGAGGRVDVLAVAFQSCMVLMVAVALAVVGALWRRTRSN
ncbi:MAG TPA: M56 family metallopeptidase [Thermoleophilaceae bacterium]|nr:M56 family metallopeptidase [Thermoleophilaceae bacterium]